MCKLANKGCIQHNEKNLITKKDHLSAPWQRVLNVQCCNLLYIQLCVPNLSNSCWDISPKAINGCQLVVMSSQGIGYVIWRHDPVLTGQWDRIIWKSMEYIAAQPCRNVWTPAPCGLSSSAIFHPALSVPCICIISIHGWLPWTSNTMLPPYTPQSHAPPVHYPCPCCVATSWAVTESVNGEEKYCNSIWKMIADRE